MKAYWAAFDTSMRLAALAARRRRLAELLRKHSVELVTVRGGQGRDAGGGRDVVSEPAVLRLAAEARGWPVIAIDDGEPMPDKAGWLARLTGLTLDLIPLKRPQVIYVTARATAAGTAQALRHPLVRLYIKRDDKGRWVVQAAEGGLVERVFPVASFNEAK